MPLLAAEMCDACLTTVAVELNLPSPAGSYQCINVIAAMTASAPDTNGQKPGLVRYGTIAWPVGNGKEKQHTDAEEHDDARLKNRLAERVAVVGLRTLLRAHHHRQHDPTGKTCQEPLQQHCAARTARECCARGGNVVGAVTSVMPHAPRARRGCRSGGTSARRRER